MINHILINDPTLRDGSHACGHQLNLEQIAIYTQAADAAGIPIVEVGHGNGIGASSLQVGLSKESDVKMLEVARKNLQKSKLGIHIIPGFATIKKDLIRAIDIGVDVIRVASHCTEADITQRHLNYVRERGKEAYGVLMMSHMASAEILLEEAQKMEHYGAEGIIIMDSAGAYLPCDVEYKVKTLVNGLKIPIGFHAHNNLGMAVANSITAIESGAKILDGTARGFGAGAGNAQLEVLVAVLEKMDFITGIDLYKILDASDIAEREIMKTIPTIKSDSIISGLCGVFSGFSKHVSRISQEFNVDPRDVYKELGKRKIVGGQEDIIIEVVMEIIKNSK
jgi:4-hydroxy 2-oxovalerate aldolase